MRGLLKEEREKRGGVLNANANSVELYMQAIIRNVYVPPLIAVSSRELEAWKKLV